MSHNCQERQEHDGYKGVRYLLKREVDAYYHNGVVVRSERSDGRQFYELYLRNGIRVGKLDVRRGWAAKIMAENGIVDKQAFLAEMACS